MRMARAIKAYPREPRRVNHRIDDLDRKAWLPGVSAHSALLWTEVPIRITGKC